MCAILRSEMDDCWLLGQASNPNPNPKQMVGDLVLLPHGLVIPFSATGGDGGSGCVLQDRRGKDGLGPIGGRRLGLHVAGRQPGARAAVPALRLPGWGEAGDIRRY